MILDPAEKIIISSLGYVDENNLWCYNIEKDHEYLIPVSSAKYLSVYRGTQGYFSVVEYSLFENSHLYSSARITARSFANPSEVISECKISESSQKMIGDGDVWKYLKRHYATCLLYENHPDYNMISIDKENNVSLHTFDFFDDSYDKDYQDIGSIIQVPDSQLLLISIARDSTLILYNPFTNNVENKISLADRHGNPKLYISSKRGELWASDYDTIVKLSLENWNIMGKQLLQPADDEYRKGMLGDRLKRMDLSKVVIKCPMGDYTFNASDSICAVARPYSGDVIGLDPDSLKVIYRAETGKQPQRLVLLENGRVFARDWKTGKLIKSELRSVKPTYTI